MTLRLREDHEEIPAYGTDDGFYMIKEGYLSPDKYLVPEDAKKVEEAVCIIAEYLELIQYGEY